MNGRSGIVFVLAILLGIGGVVYTAEPQTRLPFRSFRIRYVTDRNQVNHIVDQFRYQLSRFDSNAGIIACRNVAELTEEGSANTSFGAVCTIQNGINKATVLMCDDNLHRKFTFGETGSMTRENVVSFT